MAILELFTSNLFEPPVLFFLLGIFAGLINSDLEVPEPVGKFLSIYLMIAIGFKGGATLDNYHEPDGNFSSLILAGGLIGLLQPFVGSYFLRLTTRLDKSTIAAIAAQYGSVSIITFAITSSFLRSKMIVYSGYMAALVAMMEIPAIFSGLYLAFNGMKEGSQSSYSSAKVLRKIFSSGAILLLVGSFAIGYISGEDGYNKMEPLLVTPFQGLLAIFLLDMGGVIARKLKEMKSISVGALVFAIYMPILSAIVGVVVSKLLSLNIGDATLFTTLLASASYIAVPTVMRMTVPKANPAMYLPLSLAITFPFNVMLGVPLYFELVNYVF